MRKRIFFSVVCFLVLLVVAITFLNIDNSYNSKDIIGRDVSYIFEKYGEFDKVFYDEQENTIISGWYTIKERKPLNIFNIIKFGMTQDEYFVIVFENDEAINTYKRVGNIGG